MLDLGGRGKEWEGIRKVEKGEEGKGRGKGKGGGWRKGKGSPYKGDRRHCTAFCGPRFHRG